MITVIIPYKEDPIELAQLLVSLQPQLHPEDDIYIIDSSENGSGVAVARTYGSNRSFIYVERSNETDQEAIKLGLESMKKNKHEGALVLYPECIIPTTLIANTKKAHGKSDYLHYYFNEMIGLGGLDPNFKWFCPPPTVIPLTEDMFREKTQNAYYVKSVVFSEDLKHEKLEMEQLGCIISENIATHY